MQGAVVLYQVVWEKVPQAGQDFEAGGLLEDLLARGHGICLDAYESPPLRMPTVESRISHIRCFMRGGTSRFSV